MKNTPFGHALTELRIRMNPATPAIRTPSASSSLPALGPNDFIAEGDTHADMVTPSASPSQIDDLGRTRRLRTALLFLLVGLSAAAGYHARAHIITDLTEGRMDASAEVGGSETDRHLHSLLKIREAFGEAARQSIQADVIDEEGKKISTRNLESKIISIEHEIAQILASVNYLKRVNFQLDAEVLKLCLSDLEKMQELIDELAETVKKADSRGQSEETIAMINRLGGQLESVKAGLLYVSSQIRSLLPSQ